MESAVDRFRNAAYDLVVDGESYRPRLKPKIDASAPPPRTAAMKPPTPATRDAPGVITPLRRACGA